MLALINAQIGCRQFIYLFDVVSLGAASFDEGLAKILEDGNILKVSAV